MAGSRNRKSLPRSSDQYALLERYTVPLQMHIGAPAKLLRKAALRGQLLAEAGGFVRHQSIPLSGGQGSDHLPGVTGTQWQAVIIESDGKTQRQTHFRLLTGGKRARKF